VKSGWTRRKSGEDAKIEQRIEEACLIPSVTSWIRLCQYTGQCFVRIEPFGAHCLMRFINACTVRAV